MKLFIYGLFFWGFFHFSLSNALLAQQNVPSEVVAEAPANSGPVEKAVLSDNLEQLDEVILRRKLEKAHGEMGRAQKSNWEIGFSGELIPWEWNGKWSCSTKKEIVDCTAWIPASLQWFETKTAWLKPWTKVKKVDFLLEADKRLPGMGPVQLEPIGESIEALPQVPVHAEAIRLSGQRLA